MGLPGSSKTYHLVRRILEVVRLERRPVYTNAPLKWRVMRAYLKKRGGEEIASLVRPLSRDHFVAFMQRFVLQRDYYKDLQAAGEWKGPRLAYAAFRELHGPDFIDAQSSAKWAKENGVDDPGPNWIPPMAVLAIDEVDEWFPNPNLKTDVTVREPSELLRYLKMHRHVAHWLWFITQKPRQVSPTIKTMTAKFWVVWDKGETVLVSWLGLKLCHLGLRWIGLCAYMPEEWDENKPGRPCENRGEWPSAPWNQWVFRLYHPFSHGTSLREMNRVQREMRKLAGLDETGATVAERARKERSEVKKTKRMWWPLRWAWFVMRWTLRVAVLVVVLLAGVALGGGFGGKEEVAVESDEVASAEVAPILGIDRAKRIGSIGKDWVRVDGVECGVGGSCNGLSLCSVDARAGRSVWIDNSSGDFWVWSVGRGPQRFGTYDDVVERITGSGEGLGAGASSAGDPAGEERSGGEDRPG